MHEWAIEEDDTGLFWVINAPMGIPEHDPVNGPLAGPFDTRQEAEAAGIAMEKEAETG